MATVPTPAEIETAAAARTWRLSEAPWTGFAPLPPTARVIVDNDFSGDPDDLFQLVHHLLCPSVEVRMVIGSHLGIDDGFDPSPDSAAHAALVAHGLFARMGVEDTDRILAGAAHAMPDAATPVDSPAARAIIAEAMRQDTALPLFYAAGGGLTDVASALLLEPAIASRMTVVWIGGEEHEGLGTPPPGVGPLEYNLAIDLAAAQAVFASEVPIWQVPRDAYRRALVSDAELRARVRPAGAVGAYLYGEIRAVMEMVAPYLGAVGETYVMGDQPLVLLTALRALFEPDTATSDHVVMATPAITDAGGYKAVPGARPMRVYTRLDGRLMFEDLYAKLGEFARWQSAGA